MTPLKHTHKLRSLIPQAGRERLYEWHPGRARRWRRHPGIQRIEPGGRAILTLDDGPDEDATPAVLDALDKAASRATFFVLATQIAKHPTLAREMVERGHEVALHGYDHQRHDRISDADSRDDVVRSFEAVHEVVGVRCRWFRPPYGKMSEASAAACRDLEMTPVYWSAWGRDWEELGPERIATVASEQLDDGGILLLHDSARYARRRSALATAGAIPMIATTARQRGISLISLSEAA